MPYKMTSGKWRAKRMIEGKTKTKVFLTKREAMQWENEQTAENWQAQEDAAQQTNTAFCLHEIMTAYLDWCKDRFVKKTFKEKLQAIRQVFLTVKQDALPDTVTPALALQILQKVARQSSGNAANKVRKNLSAAWEWGKKYHGLTDNPWQQVDKFAADAMPRYVPPEADFWKVYHAATEQDQLLLLFLLHTGARRGEAFRLLWSDVDLAGHKVRLGTRKTATGGMEYAWIPLTSVLHTALAKHKLTSLSQYVFTSARTKQPFCNRKDYMKNLCTKAGVKPFGFHAIRHLAATLLAYGGLDIPSVQAVLRHHNPNTTARYIKSLGVQQDKLEDVFVTKSKGPKVLAFEPKKMAIGT